MSGRQFTFLEPSVIQVGDKQGPVSGLVQGVFHTKYATPTLMKRAETRLIGSEDPALPCSEHELCLVRRRPDRPRPPRPPRPETQGSPVDVGQRAIVVSGQFKNVRGTVSSKYDDRVLLELDMKSKKMILELRDSEVRPL